MRKTFRPTKNPRRRNGTMVLDPRWHATHEIYHTLQDVAFTHFIKWFGDPSGFAISMSEVCNALLNEKVHTNTI